MKENYSTEELSACFRSVLPSVLAANGLDSFATPEFTDKYCAFYSFLLEENAKYNLTAVVSPSQAALLHFADSLTVAGLPDTGSNLLDVGSGAGFPAVPVAIARPDVSVCALDSTGKKVDFINAAAKLLGLRNLSAVCGRAEEVGNGFMRGRYAFVTARAVAPLNVLCEICTPMLKTGGVFIAMKGGSGADEADACRKTCYGRLNLTEIERKCFSLTAESETGMTSPESPGDIQTYTRTVILIGKSASTPPAYPRRYAQIKKSPL